jgi:hypothetical protein
VGRLANRESDVWGVEKYNRQAAFMLTPNLPPYNEFISFHQTFLLLCNERLPNEGGTAAKK